MNRGGLLAASCAVLVGLGCGRVERDPASGFSDLAGAGGSAGSGDAVDGMGRGGQLATGGQLASSPGGGGQFGQGGQLSGGGQLGEAGEPSQGGASGSAGGSGFDVRTCGNGTLDVGEFCDDGNSIAGDGCSASCIVEAGFSCHSTPSACNRSCKGVAKSCGPNHNGDCCAAALVPGGAFLRSNDPAYPATVSSFRLDSYEITVGRFRRFVAGYPANKPAAGSGKNPHDATDSGWDETWNDSALAANQDELTGGIECSMGGAYPGVDYNHQTWTANNDSLPMNCIDWYEAQAFCIWDGGRLPTEAEWNYAAAGGSEQRVFPWGNSEPGADAALAAYYCYFGNEIGGCDQLVNIYGVTNIAPVGSIAAGNGKWGHADLAGNLSEWIQDGQAPYLTPCLDCATRVRATSIPRGGNFTSPSVRVRTTTRIADLNVDDRDFTLGARCARTAPAPAPNP